MHKCLFKPITIVRTIETRRPNHIINPNTCGVKYPICVTFQLMNIILNILLCNLFHNWLFFKGSYFTFYYPKTFGYKILSNLQKRMQYIFLKIKHRWVDCHTDPRIGSCRSCERFLLILFPVARRAMRTHVCTQAIRHIHTFISGYVPTLLRMFQLQAFIQPSLYTNALSKKLRTSCVCTYRSITVMNWRKLALYYSYKCGAFSIIIIITLVPEFLPKRNLYLKKIPFNIRIFNRERRHI